MDHINSLLIMKYDMENKENDEVNPQLEGALQAEACLPPELKPSGNQLVEVIQVYTNKGMYKV